MILNPGGMTPTIVVGFGGLAVQADGTSDHVRIRTKAAMPKAVADDRDERRAGTFLTGSKKTSHLGICAENSEKVGRHHANLHLLGFAFSSQSTALRPDSTEVFK